MPFVAWHGDSDAMLPQAPIPAIRAAETLPPGVPVPAGLSGPLRSVSRPPGKGSIISRI